MKTLRALLAVAVLGVGLVACGGDPRTDIEAMFKGYHTATLARDFPAACAYNSPEATATLLASIASQGITVRTCEEALAAIYAESGAAAAADATSRGFRIDAIDVDGDQAAITFTAPRDGEDYQATFPLRRIDGDWKFGASD
jgi:hypothetical protein